VAQIAIIKGKTLTLQPVEDVPEISLYLSNTRHYKASQEERFECWPFAWVGGRALARFILDNPSYVQGKTVVDLCSGSGIVAIAAKMAGAARVIAVDDYNYSIDTINLNMAANNVEIETLQQDVYNYTPDYGDIFLMGDPFMDENLFPHIKANFAPVLVGCPLTKRAEYYEYYNDYVVNPIATYSFYGPDWLEDFDETMDTHIWWLSE